MLLELSLQVRRDDRWWPAVSIGRLAYINQTPASVLSDYMLSPSYATRPSALKKCDTRDSCSLRLAWSKRPGLKVRPSPSTMSFPVLGTDLIYTFALSALIHVLQLASKAGASLSGECVMKKGDLRFFYHRCHPFLPISIRTSYLCFPHPRHLAPFPKSLVERYIDTRVYRGWQRRRCRKRSRLCCKGAVIPLSGCYMQLRSGCTRCFHVSVPLNRHAPRVVPV